MIREEIIASYIDGKNVLDIGSLGQTAKYCLWDVLAKHAATLTGIDLEVSPETLAARFGVTPGQLPQDQRIVEGDMETHDFGRTFDVITACDVIEHVENQGRLLRNVRRHLTAGGRLILTTPNAKWPTVALRPNPTHTLWHDRYTLARIFHACGFTIEVLRYYCGNKPRYGLFKRLLCLRQSLLAVCVSAAGSPVATTGPEQDADAAGRRPAQADQTPAAPSADPHGGLSP